METRGLGMGFSGIDRFGFDKRKDFFEKWARLTTEEKVIFIDEKMEAMESMPDKHRFSMEFIDKFCNEWVSKTTEEKEEFIQKEKEAFGRHGFHGHGFGFEFDEDCE
ncbi:MAG: hypothetical protein LBL79_13195 [Prevotella sp.]|jgi:hypothetical protein|nr:hypothetical protein [Prevotella sp.]